MNTYDWKITLKKFCEAAGMAMLLAGLTALAEGIESRATLGAIATGVGLALLRALQNYVKNIGKDGAKPPYDTAIMLLFVIGACATFSGCMSLAPYSSGALSSNNVRVSESVSTEYGKDTFNIEVKSRGEAAAKTGLDYSAGGESPWRFILNGEANVDSVERVLPLTTGAGAALAALPETLGPLVQAFAAVQDAAPGSEGATIRDRILQMIIERVLGAVTGGLAP